MKAFDTIIAGMKSGARRFGDSFLYSAAAFVFTVAFIFNDNFTPFMYAALAAAFALVLSVVLRIAGERFEWTGRLSALACALTLAAAAVLYYILYISDENTYVYLGYAGVTGSLVILLVLLMTNSGSRDSLIPYLVKSILLSGVIALIIFGGTALCALAVNFLIYEFSSQTLSRIIFNLLALAFELVFVFLVLSLLPRRNGELTIPKVFKVIVLYVMFPVYLLLLAVLYIYLLKILFTLNMPGGQLNWFASYAELFFIFFNYTLPLYDCAPVRLWKRFGGFFMLPIIAVQAIAVYIRISVYGLTTARWVSILFSAVAAVFIILSVINEGKHRSASLWLLIGVLLISTLTPLNFIDVPVYEQTARLQTILIRNGMLFDGIVAPNSGIPREDMIAVTSCYDAVYYSEKAPGYIKSGKSFYELFGFDPAYPYQDVQGGDYENGYVYYTSTLPSLLDISAYSTMLEVSAEYEEGSGNELSIVFKVENVDYDLTDELLTITNESNGESVCFEKEGVVFYVTDFNSNYYLKDDGTVVYDYVYATAYAFVE